MDQYIKIKIYILGLTGIAKFFKKVYIMELLKARLLFGINIINPEGIINRFEFKNNNNKIL